jgi:molecular chaperone GrpE
MTRKNKAKKNTEPDADAIAEAAPSEELTDGPTIVLSPLETLQAERDDLMARLQRTAADYANSQKRSQREMAEARDYANTQLITGLLSVLDDMERALEAAGDGCDKDDPLLIGMQLVHDKALEVLGRFGVEIIEALDKPFDPESHAAMMQQPSDEHPPQTVLQELQRGYKLKGRTIRPTAVIVSMAPESEEQTAEDDAEENTVQD